MKIKVCGMRQPANIVALSALPIDFMGLICYPKSPRYVDSLNPADLDVLPTSIKRVGVFVNESIEEIGKKINLYKLDLVQLHGSESPEFCLQIKSQYSISVIKALNVSEAADLEKTKVYNDACDYFLFDTKTKQHGGSGQKFDWDILNAYTDDKPFFLSGGISAEDAGLIKQIKHPQLYALDINSKFETEPGLKNIELIEQFIKRLRDE